MTYSVTNGSTSIDNGYLLLNQGGGGGGRAINVAFTDAAFTSHDCYSLEFDWGGCSSSEAAANMTISSASATLLNISWAGYATTATVIDGSNNTLTSALPVTAYIKGGGTLPETWSHFTFNVNSLGVYLTITSGGTTLVDNVRIAAQQNITKMGGSLGRYNSKAALDNIVLSSYDDVAATLDYTINYTYNNATIKQTTGTGADGQIITIENPITVNEQQYYATDDAPTSLTLSNGTDNVLNVPLRLPNTYNYSVVAKDGSNNILADITSGTYTEGNEAITVAYPQYILSGTTLYSIANKGSGDWFRKTFTPNVDNYELTLYYNGETVSNVAYYTEAEDVTNASVGNYTNRASNGKVGYTGSATTYLEATTLTSGKYVIYAKGLNGNKDPKSANFKLGDNVFEFSITQGTNQRGNSTEFTIYETSTLSFGSDGNSTAGGVDWFYVVRTGDATINGTIASSGYSSLASAYALDFANATGLAAAYVVNEITKDAVKLTSVTEMPANSGVILKGEGGAAYSIPVKASATFNGTNKLQAAVTATVVENDKAYILQGGQFCLVTGATSEEDRTIPAGKAYLLATDVPSQARSLGFFVDNEGTGIEAVARELGNGEFYNVQGQRISTPKQGLYIVNGKKVIIK